MIVQSKLLSTKGRKSMKNFDEIYRKFFAKDIIEIKCANPTCESPIRHVSKTRAQQTIKNNKDKFDDENYYCRSCSLKRYYELNPDTSERNKKISNAHMGKKVSDETKKRMSNAKKEFYQTEEGEAMKLHLSQEAAKNATTKETPRRSGYWFSTKMNKELFYGSSYELKTMILLDGNENVKDYQCQLSFITEKGKGRRLDFLINYIDGTVKLVEIKPFAKLEQDKTVEQLDDNKKYAEENNFIFEVWTEKELGFKTPSEATKWADEFMSVIQKFDYVELRNKKNREKAKRWRENHKDEMKITFWCEFCGEEHTRDKWHYNKNVEKNERFICDKENGSITGKKPGRKKENPYAADGKKECADPKCLNKIKPFEEFNSDKSRADGYSSICRECNQKRCKERYERKTGKQ